MNEEEIVFPNEPVSWTDTDKESVRRLFVWIAENKGNDVNISSGSKVSMQKDGKIKRVTRKILNDDDVKNILFVIFESEAARADLLSGKDRDFAYSVKSKDGKRFRFRVNATAILSRDSSGIQITARTINSIPPRVTDFNVDQEILDNYMRDEGMVVFAGSTGTGKSTLMASIIRQILETPDSHKKIITYEAPIEFVYEDVISESSIIFQTEVYRHLPNFSSAVRNALRRAPDIILIGEARDAETIEQSIIASQSGHLLFTTTHTNGVSETIKRMVNEFSKEDRNSRALDLISAMNMIVSQKLVYKVGGGRVALREYLVFTNEIKQKLQTVDVDNLSYHVRELLKKHGQTFFMDAKKKYEENLIDLETLKRLEYLDTAEDRDHKAEK